MNRAGNLIIQRKVSREIFMKFMYQIAVTKDQWDNLTDKLMHFLDMVEEDAIEIYKSYGGRDIEEFENYREVVLDISYLIDISEAVENHIEDIDAYINRYARNWTVDTMPIVDISILRVAIAEIKFMYTVPNRMACDAAVDLAKKYSDTKIEVPSGVSCHEAVNLAKKYCDDNAYKYINGILGSVVESE